MASRKKVELLRAELAAVALGDERLNRRAREVSEKLGLQPSESLPSAMGNNAALEATYRLLGNEQVTPEKLLAPHRECTVARAADARKAGRPLLAIHDTTEATFGGEYLREGLGYLSNGTQGFFAHATLLATREGEVNDPLGVLLSQTLTRTSKKGRKSGTQLAKAGHEGEARRWLTGMERAHELVPDSIQVADREADAYWLMAALQRQDIRFIFRNKLDRRVRDADGDDSLLRESLEQLPVVALDRNVKAGARHPGETGAPSKTGKKALKGAAYVRTPSSKKYHPARSERLTRLQAQAAPVTIRRPNSESRELPASLSINAVRVFEPSPPAGQEPIEWFLLTSEPISNTAEIEAVIDGYRTRWLVEEFFKALKTGCNYENSQLESLSSLENLLAFYMPIAWRMLRMRAASRTGSKLSAKELLTPVQLQLLCIQFPAFRKLANPSATEALFAVAALVGHIKNNGPPGWILIGRGFDHLLERELGFIQALAWMQK